MRAVVTNAFEHMTVHYEPGDVVDDHDLGPMFVAFGVAVVEGAPSPAALGEPIAATPTRRAAASPKE